MTGRYASLPISRFPPSPVPRHCEASAHTGCGNPLPPSKLSAFVPRKPRGISRGPQPPGRWGRIPKGTAFGIGSLWRVFAYFLHVEKVGRRRRRDRIASRRDKRRIRRDLVDCPLRRGVTSQSAASRRLPAPLKGSLHLPPLARNGDRRRRWRGLSAAAGRDLDGSISRSGATPFLLAEKTNYEMSRQKMRIGWKLKNGTPNQSVQLGALNSGTMIYTG